MGREFAGRGPGTPLDQIFIRKSERQIDSKSDIGLAFSRGIPFQRKKMPGWLDYLECGFPLMPSGRSEFP